jgi:hypothetical protein
MKHPGRNETDKAKMNANQAESTTRLVVKIDSNQEKI